VTALRRFIHRLIASLSRQRPDARLEEEFALHIEAQTADNVRAGLSPDEARRQARLKFGSLDVVMERARDTHGLPSLERLFADFRHAARAMVRAPSFTVAVVAVLAIGIGASTAIFSIVNAVLLRPLPLESPDRLVRVFTVLASGRSFEASPGKFHDWQRDARSFESMAIYPCCGARQLALTGTGSARSVKATAVSSDFFDVVKARPAFGRVLGEADDTPGGRHVVVLSDRFWRSEFGGDVKVLGRTLRLDDEPYTVVGVLRADASLASWTPLASDVWMPLALTAEQRTSRGGHYLDAVARLRPGVDVAQAQAEMNAISARLAREFPKSDGRWGARVVSLQDEIGGGSQTMLLLLLGAVGLVQLIACANASNLLFTRTVARRKEFAVRAALGAGRWRVFRQLLTEAALLAATGGAIGVGLAFAILTASSALLATHVPRAEEIAIDSRVLLFAVAMSIVCGALAGTLPAWRAGRPDLNDALKQGGRGGSTVGVRTRRVLVASEVALSLVLLMGAGVLIQSLLNLRYIDTGFNPENVLTMRVRLVDARYPTPAQRSAFFETALRQIRVLPGVEAAGTIDDLPFSAGEAQTLEREGYPPQEDPVAVQVRQVTPGYLAAMDIPVLRGRDARDGDADVLLVSEQAATIFWGSDDPIGRRASLPGGGSATLRTVVGIVGDVKQRTLSDGPTPTVYSYTRTPSRRATFAVRTSVPPGSIAPAAVGAIRAIDPEQPVVEIRTMAQVRDETLAPQRLSALLLGVFAGVALLLAAIGIYSVLAYIVRGRSREIGIRAALGAQSVDVCRLVLSEGLPTVLVGIVAGVLGALASAKVLEALVFGVSASDPRTLAATAATLVVVALLAGVLPAYRALRLDPSKVLQAD
jgi:putative ABC transport system permease protein